jgi:hypothetical protein
MEAGGAHAPNSPMTARFYYDPVQAAYSPDGVGNYFLRTIPTVIAGQNSANVVQPSDASKSLARGCCGVSDFNKDMPDPRVQDWNLTVEKEIMANTVARAGYFGNHSTRLEQLYQFNDSTPDYICIEPPGRHCPGGTPMSPGDLQTRPATVPWSAGRTPAGATPMASSSNWSGATQGLWLSDVLRHEQRPHGRR